MIAAIFPHGEVPLTIDPLEVPVSSSNLTKGLEATVDDSDDEKLGLSESKEDLQQTLSSLEFKLKAADEEKCRIKKELEGLMEKHRILETDFLKDKEATLISHQDQYNKLMILAMLNADVMSSTSIRLGFRGLGRSIDFTRHYDNDARPKEPKESYSTFGKLMV
ncbi:Coiled-coil domain-containing protein 91 [Varanus komodoensis]|nr:Coiled-coil domain-containing protein 91 [Varanus komodoensis]